MIVYLKENAQDINLQITSFIIGSVAILAAIAAAQLNHNITLSQCFFLFDFLN